MKKLSVLLVLAIVLGFFANINSVEAAFPYAYQLVNQSSYPSLLIPGEVASVWIEVKNTGSKTWANTGTNPVRLGTGSKYGASNQQKDYASEFYNQGTWISANRPASIRDAVILPGWHTRFEFKIKAPATAGTYKAYFTPVIEGLEWMKDIGIFWEIKVEDPSNIVSEGESLGAISPDNKKICATGLIPYLPVGEIGTRGTCQKPNFTPASKVASEHNYGWVGQSINPTIEAGTFSIASLTLKNTGNASWYRNQPTAVKIGTANIQDRASIFTDTASGSGWSGANRVVMKEESVAPGANATFEFNFKVPTGTATGKYKEYFRPLVEGVTWLKDVGIYWEVTVAKATSDSQNQNPTNQNNSAQSGANINVVSLSLSPNTPITIKTGTTSNYTLTATYSDGSAQDVTSLATWDVEADTGTGSFYPPGRFIAGSYGTCWVTATFGGKSVRSAIITITGL